MSDAEWAMVRPLLPVPVPVPGRLRGRGGQPEAYCHRAMLDAGRYLVDNGTKWRVMPADFPPWDRVYAFFRRWRDHGMVKEFHDRLRSKVREQAGREPEPTAGVIDGGKLVNGRKRHAVVDTLGLLLGVIVTSADIGDRAAGQVLLAQVAAAHHRPVLVWADGGYTGSLVEYALAALALVLAIVKRSDGMRGFVVLPKRWIVELSAQLEEFHRGAEGIRTIRKALLEPPGQGPFEPQSRSCWAIRPTRRSWRCSTRPASHCGCGRCARHAAVSRPESPEPARSSAAKRQVGPASRTGSSRWTYAGAIGPGGLIHEHYCRLTCCGGLLSFRDAGSPSRFDALQVGLGRVRVATCDRRSSGAGATRRPVRAVAARESSQEGHEYQIEV
ncbi:IS5 family transposase [Streptomyces sp. NPDC013171]|uniref:IS5 family transposase n=1 Tax=Streptomyces sp. NPDC013171 TaxID=3364863 RepID=UPI0036C16878